MTDITAPPEPRRYHSGQIMLHWLVVSLVIFQFAGGWAMESAMDEAYATGTRMTAGIVVVHAILGLSILLAMIVRAVFRHRYGAPPPPQTESSAVQWLSRGVHFAFYALLLAMPLFGLAAIVTLSATLGWRHGLASWAVLGLAVLHVAGALLHAVRGDGVIRRMVSRAPPRV